MYAAVELLSSAIRGRSLRSTSQISTFFLPNAKFSQAVAAAERPKDLRASVSSSLMSKTVYNLVICIRSCTLFVSFSSFSSPPYFRTVVKALTSRLTGQVFWCKRAFLKIEP